MTTGAIHGNFKNRDELFIALGHHYWAPIRPKLTPGTTFADALRALAKATLAAVDERQPVAVGRLTGLAYTLQTPELRVRVLDVTKRSYELGAEWLRTFDTDELPMPSEQFVVVLHAVMEGLIMQHILTPELCPDEIFFAAFSAMAVGGRARHSH